MPECALVGCTGFVGSNLTRQSRFDALFNSANIESIANRDFDTLVFSGAQSKKWWANLNPDADWSGIKRAIDAMSNVSARRTILISTIDVLSPDDEDGDELKPCSVPEGYGYGPNRLRLEDWFRRKFSNALIVRLPALFGAGLKKNVIFDLMNDNGLDKINRNSTFQYYDVSRLWSDIGIAIREGLPLVHLFTAPVQTGEIIDRYFGGKVVGQDASPEAHYKFRSRYGRIFGGDDNYIENRESVLRRLGAFISAETKGVAP